MRIRSGSTDPSKTYAEISDSLSCICLIGEKIITLHNDRPTDSYQPIGVWRILVSY